MKDLIDKLPELYQDIVIDGKVIAKGVRDCESRWDLIKDCIPLHGVVMDLGSSVGYFAHRIAREFPDTLVISFESEPDMCEIQKEIFRREGIYNVVVCNYRLRREELEGWVECVECFDLVLTLSVLHHFPEKDVRVAYSCLNALAPKVITEVTGFEEDEACGGEVKDIVRDMVTHSGAGLLGSVKSHLGNYERDLLIKVLHPAHHISRVGLDAYIGVSHEGRHKFDLTWKYEEKWRLGGRNIISGINVYNLLYFNIVWPESKWWIEQARGAYLGLDFKSDVRLWNLLVTSTGLKAIDYTHRYPDGDQASYDRSDLTRMEDVIKGYVR